LKNLLAGAHLPLSIMNETLRKCEKCPPLRRQSIVHRFE